MSTILFVCALVWTILVEGVLSADHCYNWYNGETYYCQYGCCGDGWDKHCCTITGIIVGACIGGIVLISLIVVAICCCMKHKGKSGRVIGTTTTTSTVAMVGTSNYSTPMGYSGWTYGQPQPSGGPVPPPYQAQAQYPPGPPPSEGMYNDPAYPPASAPPPYKR